MRSLHRVLLCSAALAIGAFAGRVQSSSSIAPNRDAELAGFGGVVLVGDGEVFAGEAANQFRPGMVYVYRKNGTAWQEAATLTAPKAAVGDGFGATLAQDGDRLFVGAGAGAVHLFTKQAGAWTFASTISAGDVPATAIPAAPGPAPVADAATPVTAAPPVSASASLAQTPPAARFGAIAAAGDWLLIGKEVPGGGRGRGGAPGGGRGRGDAGPQPPGAVFAFKRDAGGRYAFHSALQSAEASTRPGDSFGSSIALSGTTALIGASGEANRAGVVHELALGADGAWTTQRTFAPVGVQGNELFGAAISATGDHAVVAAPGDAGGYGAVYVFRKVTQGGRGRGAGAAAAGANVPPPAAGASTGGNFVWTEVARLAAPAGGRTDRFAAALTADDREVWVGAPGAGGPGRVFVFPWSATGFQLDGLKLLGPSWADPAAAGVSLSMRGNVAAVGATGANRFGGGLFIYERDSFGAWREQPMITTPIDELPAFTGSERRCNTTTGKIEMFECGATDLLSFLPPSKLSHDGHYIAISSIWGWTDPQTKQEWALLGRRDGTAFVDITSPTNPRSVADLPLTDGARPSAWREIKVYKDHAFIVSDGAGPHGIQIFDLTRLRTMKPQPNGLPQKVQADAIYRNVNSVHNMVINEESGFGYPVGSSAGGNDLRRRPSHDRPARAEEPEVHRLLRRQRIRARWNGLLARCGLRHVQGPGQAVQEPGNLRRFERNGDQPRGRHRQGESQVSVTGRLPERRLHAPGLVRRGAEVLLRQRRVG